MTEVILLLSVLIVLVVHGVIIYRLKEEITTLQEISLESLDNVMNRTTGVEENLMLVAKNLTNLTNAIVIEDEGSEGPNTKPSSLKQGGTFETIIDCKILGSFFYKDKKYAVVTPYINDMYIAIPSVVGINTEGSVEFNLGTDSEAEEIKEKAGNIYEEFRKNNPDSFVGE